MTQALLGAAMMVVKLSDEDEDTLAGYSIGVLRRVLADAFPLVGEVHFCRPAAVADSDWPALAYQHKEQEA